LATKQGRTGGYTVDRSMSLPPLNFTPREAAAVAVALSRSEHVLFARDARSALQWRTVEQLEYALFEYLDWWNHRRLHAEIGMIPPAEKEATYYAQPPALTQASAQ
jgi:predicted DNA-binding transcriptional regulator YafY